MNVLVTGGTGFIGSRLALRWLEQGHRVTVLGQVNTEAEAANRALVESAGAALALASVTSRDAVARACRGVDVVYHLAAAQHEAGAPDRHFHDVNVGGTRNVVEAAVAAGVRRVVHGSTIGVFGAGGPGPVHERSPLAPDNIYGRTKLEAERLALAARARTPVVIVRISETYGPGDRRLLKLFRAIKRRRFVLIGGGDNLHHPIYVADLVDGLVRAATAEAAVGHAFVLAGAEALTTRQMVETIAARLGVAPRRLRVPLRPVLGLATAVELACRPLGLRPPLHRRRMEFFRKSFRFSLEGGRRLLGFVPKWSFAQGVEETARWYSETAAR